MENGKSRYKPCADFSACPAADITTISSGWTIQTGLAEITRCQEHSRKTYGYRRVQLWLEQQGIHRNPKTVLRIMRKYGLLSEVRRRKKYRVMGQQLHRYENLLNRDFTAQRPNQKWVTDISYIHTAKGVLYLSIIRDLFDNSIVVYKTRTDQSVGLFVADCSLSTQA